jgi:hypothetical protein
VLRLSSSSGRLRYCALAPPLSGTIERSKSIAALTIMSSGHLETQHRWPALKLVSAPFRPRCFLRSSLLGTEAGCR